MSYQYYEPNYPGYGYSQMSFVPYQQQHQFQPTATPTTTQVDDKHLLYIGNLEIGVNTDEIEGLFSQFGEIENIMQPRGKNYLFLRFKEEEAARVAKETMNNTRYGSLPMKINYGKTTLTTDKKDDKDDNKTEFDQQHREEITHDLDGEPTKTLWIGGLQNNETEIVKQFSQFGLIERIRLVKQKNCAFIEFKEVEIATNAKTRLTNILYHDHHIRVRFAKETLTQSRYWYPEMPSNTPTKSYIDGIVTELLPYLINHGVAFEELVKQKCASDPHFDFLKENNIDLGYYKWRVFSEVLKDFNINPEPVENEGDDDDEIPPWAMEEDDENSQ
ncbi:Uncharacterized protein QTN25_008048 [Entamoeba marina]